MTQESINAVKVSNILDKMSLQVRKRTFVVLDNAMVHRNAKLKELRSIWESRGLFLFFPASIFSRTQSRGNSLAYSQGQMDPLDGLCLQ